MSLKALFQKIVVELQKQQIPFAVAGGLAADVYRREPRLTMDVDLVIAAEKNTAAVAASALKAIGLSTGVLRRADMNGGPMFAIKKKSTRPCMVTGRHEGETAGEGVDILLPEIPWVPEAVKRAQDNPVDFGFGAVPVLTIEDVVISKLYALQSAHLRAKDLDDLQSIFETNVELNVPYLAGRIGALAITIPRAAKPLLPPALIAVVRDASRAAKHNR